MTRGIKVFWPNKNDANEIEFFHGIDVEHLDQIPQFATVPALWPRHEGGTLGGTLVEYNVHTCCKPCGPGEAHLVVQYDQAANEVLVRAWGHDINWGTNTIIIRRGEQNGTCRWRDEDATDSYEIPWTTYDLGENNARPRALLRVAAASPISEHDPQL